MTQGLSVFAGMFGEEFFCLEQGRAYTGSPSDSKKSLPAASGLGNQTRQGGAKDKFLGAGYGVKFCGAGQGVEICRVGRSNGETFPERGMAKRTRTNKKVTVLKIF